MTKKIKTAFIGLGYRGNILLKLAGSIDDFQIVAIAEPDPAIVPEIKEYFKQNNLSPAIYTNTNDCYIDMLKSEDIDLVFVASPWHLHYKHATTVLNFNYNLALEVKGSLFEGEYQQLHKLARKRNLSIYPLENTVFMRNVMAVTRMVDEGIFGEIVFAQGAYRHDLRDVLTENETAWRIKYYETENGDIYPTHSIAPISLMLKINRGNKFNALTSFATKAIGMNLKTSDSETIKIPGKSQKYILGDVITTIISTDSGGQITLFHDTTLPRPRSFSYEIQGTKGAWNYDLKSIYIEGISPKEEWENEEKYTARYEHPFWIKWGKEALIYDTHHKGMDYIMLKALASDFINKDIFPIDILDQATWADISIKSKESIRERKTIYL